MHAIYEWHPICLLYLLFILYIVTSSLSLPLPGQSSLSASTFNIAKSIRREITPEVQMAIPTSPASQHKASQEGKQEGKANECLRAVARGGGGGMLGWDTTWVQPQGLQLL